MQKWGILILLLTCSLLILTSCLNIPPSTVPLPETASPPSPTPPPEPTLPPEPPPLLPEPSFVDIGAFIAEPDWEPSWTQEQIDEVKANIDRHFGVPYYTVREYYMNIYEPYDISKLEKALADLSRLPWSYEASYFDCSEMSALVELYLEMSHFDTVIVVGSNPEVQGQGHAWIVTYVRDPEYKEIPIEATELSIPKPTGNLYGKPPSQTVMNYEDFLDNGWTLRDIYEAITYEPNDFDWWNSYPVSINELFGEPAQAIMPDDPGIPQIITTHGVAIRPWFVWNAVSWADYYNLELALDSEFILPIVSTTVITNDYMLDFDLDYSTTYFWRIRALSSEGWSKWAYGTFTTKSRPPQTIP